MFSTLTPDLYRSLKIHCLTWYLFGKCIDTFDGKRTKGEISNTNFNTEKLKPNPRVL